MNILNKWLSRKIFIFILALSNFTSITYGSSTFKIAYFSISPHITDCAKPRPCGALMDYFENNIFNKMKQKIEWIGPLAIPRAIKMLKEGKVDAIPMMAKLESNSYLYSNKALVKGHWYLLYKGKFKKKRITSSKDLVGFNIAFYDAGKEYLHPFLNEQDITLTPLFGINWYERNFKKLEKNRVDAIVMPEIGPILYILKKYNAESKYQVIPFDGDGLNIHLAFSNQSSKGREFKNIYDSIYDKSKASYENFLLSFIKDMKVI